MATAASTYASSISSTSLLRLQAPTYKRNCCASVASVRCNATQERAKNAKSSSVSASRRSLLTVSVALPLSAFLTDKAWAFVEEEEITASERQRREFTKAIQERAAQAEAAVAEAAKTVESQAEAAITEVQKAAPKLVNEAPKEVGAQAESVATEAKKASDAVQGEVKTVASEVKKAPEAFEQAPKTAAAPVDNVAVEVQKAAKSVTAKVEKAAEAVGSKVEAVVGQRGGKESAGPSEAQLPLTGPNSAKRLKEAQVRTPNASEKLSGSPDDVNAADPPFQRLDSSKMPDLPYLFPKEDYGTPWVPPADFSKDKIQPFFGPWDNGPAPEKTITRPFLDNAPPQKGDESSGVSAIYLAMINLAVIGFYVVAKKAQNGELFGPPLEEGEMKEGEEGAVQQMKAEKEAFDAEEGQRVANGAGGEDSSKVEEKSH